MRVKTVYTSLARDPFAQVKMCLVTLIYSTVDPHLYELLGTSTSPYM